MREKRNPSNCIYHGDVAVLLRLHAQLFFFIPVYFLCLSLTLKLQITCRNMLVKWNRYKKTNEVLFVAQQYRIEAPDET